MIDGRNSAKTVDSRLRVHPSKSPNAHCVVSDARLPQFPGPNTVKPSCRILRSWVTSLVMPSSQNLATGALCEQKIVNHQLAWPGLF